jgi:FkbM family methyltransferase
MKYYSANGEDFLLWQFFDFAAKGAFLDIGAFDGIHFSNTYSFEQSGWRGVCVEPNPEIFPYLLRNRSHSTCLHAACVSDKKKAETTFFCEELGLLSTTNKAPGYGEFVRERYEKRGLAFSGFRTTTVPAITMDEIIVRHFIGNARMDFVSIDVEGAEMDVLQGFDARRHQPGAIVIESNHPEQSERIVAYMEDAHRYHFAGKLVENLFFVKTRADVEKLRAIRIHCTIEAQMHPLGERYTAEPYREARVIRKKVLPALK